LDDYFLINFSFISLCQDVKGKQALLGSNLSAINILTVRGNATWGDGNSVSLFMLPILSIWFKKTNIKSFGKQTFHSGQFIIAANSCISLL
jgi:hypothetical protein